jgi:hypothetical protein
MVGGVRLVIAVIVSACAIAVLIDSPRRELEEELKQQWQEYRQHTGEIPAFPATSENLSDSLNRRLDTDR